MRENYNWYSSLNYKPGPGIYLSADFNVIFSVRVVLCRDNTDQKNIQSSLVR